MHLKNSSDALKNGIGLLPEDRKTQGFLNLSTNIDNVAISSLEKYMTGIFVDAGKSGRTASITYRSWISIRPKRRF